MKIKVTQEHINKGKRIQPKCCPIALAFIAAGFCNVQVCVGKVKLGKVTIILPAAARKFMWRFDAFENGEPFEFEFNHKNPLSLWGRIKVRLFT